MPNNVDGSAPLNSESDQSDKVGRCDLEPDEKRAPMGLLEVQRFRFFSAANNLRLIDTRGNE